MQDHLLGGHGANAADRHRFDRLLDVVALLDVRHAIARVHEHFFGFGVLQAGLVRHDQPATKGFVLAVVAVYGDADIDIALIQLLGGLGQCGFHRAKDDVTLDVFLTRDGLDQHQHFPIHVTTLLQLTWGVAP